MKVACHVNNFRWVIALGLIALLTLGCDHLEKDGSEPGNMLRDAQNHLIYRTKRILEKRKRNIKSDKTTDELIRNSQDILNDLKERLNNTKPYFSITENGYGKGNPNQAAVILFGIDAATWTILNPLLEAGKLPNLKRLLQRSSYGWMDTDVALSPISWTSIVTGKTWQKTMELRDGDIDNVWELTDPSILTKRIWDILSRPDGKGLVVINYYFPPSQKEYPRMVRIPLQEKGETPPDGHILRCMDNQFEPYQAHSCIASALRQLRFEFFFCIIRETDILQHKVYLNHLLKHHPVLNSLKPINQPVASAMKKAADPLTALTIEVDTTIGNLMKKKPDAYVFIVSDHGFSLGLPYLHLNYNQEVLRNLHMKSKQCEGCVHTFEWNGKNYSGSITSKKKAIPCFVDETTKKPLDLIVQSEQFIFRPEDNSDDHAAKEFQAYLQAFNDRCSPDEGGPLFEIARTRNTITFGIAPHGIEALLARQEEPHSCIKTEWGGFDHLRDNPGVLIASGPGIARGRVIEKASLFDVTPTILYLKGQPVGRDMDGRVLTEMLDPAMLAERPVTYIPTHDDQAFKQSRSSGTRMLSGEELDRLQSLGYLN